MTVSITAKIHQQEISRKLELIHVSSRSHTYDLLGICVTLASGTTNGDMTVSMLNDCVEEVKHKILLESQEQERCKGRLLPIAVDSTISVNYITSAKAPQHVARAPIGTSTDLWQRKTVGVYMNDKEFELPLDAFDSLEPMTVAEQTEYLSKQPNQLVADGCHWMVKLPRLKETPRVGVVLIRQLDSIALTAALSIRAPGAVWAWWRYIIEQNFRRADPNSWNKYLPEEKKVKMDEFLDSVALFTTFWRKDLESDLVKCVGEVTACVPGNPEKFKQLMGHLVRMNMSCMYYDFMYNRKQKCQAKLTVISTSQIPPEWRKPGLSHRFASYLRAAFAPKALDGMNSCFGPNFDVGSSVVAAKRKKMSLPSMPYV